MKSAVLISEDFLKDHTYHERWYYKWADIILWACQERASRDYFIY